MNQPRFSPSLFSRRLLSLSALVVAVENDDDDDGLLSYPSLLAFILSPEQLPNDT